MIGYLGIRSAENCAACGAARSACIVSTRCSHHQPLMAANRHSVSRTG